MAKKIAKVIQQLRHDRTNEKYGFFHPENNRRFVAELSFGTIQEAIVYLKKERPPWSQMEKCSSRYEAAFISSFGEKIAIRAIED